VGCLTLLTRAIPRATCFAADGTDKTKSASIARTTTTTADSFSVGPRPGLLETDGFIDQQSDLTVALVIELLSTEPDEKR